MLDGGKTICDISDVPRQAPIAPAQTGPANPASLLYLCGRANSPLSAQLEEAQRLSARVRELEAEFWLPECDKTPC